MMRARQDPEGSTTRGLSAGTYAVGPASDYLVGLRCHGSSAPVYAESASFVLQAEG